MQPDCSGTMTCRLPLVHLQKQGVGGPRRPLPRIALRALPREEPVHGRLEPRRVARLRFDSARVEGNFGLRLGEIPHRQLPNAWSSWM